MEGLREVLDRALAAERGLKLVFKEGTAEQNSAAATHQRARMHKLRAEDRRRSYEIYPADHPQRGQSPWDILFISKKPMLDGSCELHVIKSSLANFTYEEL